jgi:putative spermidine/putrescine transport system substrate-binding protein/spermidine/putrescine transport system substrate-binding protein
LWGKLVEQNLVKPVDVSQISNYTQLSQMMRSVPAATGGQVYAVPIAWASDVLVYNTDVFPQPPNSYAVLFDPKFKGKVAGWDNSATLGVTGLYLGYKQPFSTTKKQLDAVKKLLCKQFPLVLLYGAQAGDYVNAFKDGDAVVGLASGLLITNALRKGNVNNVDWTIPKEGALIRVDGVLLSNGSGNSQAAQQLIDYLLSPQIQQQISERLGSAPANSAAYEQLPGEIKQQLARQQPDQNPNLRFELWSQVENYDTWTQTWNDIKAGC